MAELNSYWVGREFVFDGISYFGFDGLDCATVEEALERAEVMREMGVTVFGIYNETNDGIAEVVKF